MSEEEKQIMNKMIYCNLVSGEQAIKFNLHIKQIEEENKRLKDIIKEAKDFIKGKDLKENEYRYAEDFDFIKLLEILDKENK